ncbi:oligopeptide/dipeptide ABC transporter ATP-binding protein [Pseudonocardia sp. NPDC049635]|uniref:ABC transporter ATP-binding protein n=1 Tax=Pseudonocardia sp. NPDC049635 TaxID=3155506 RepID=UPI003405E345
MAESEILEVQDLTKDFRRGRGPVTRAVRGVSFTVRQGETLAVVGESGCGKSTTARLVARLMQPTSGRVIYDGVDVTRYSTRRMRPLRPLVQMVFQDSWSALDPRMTCRDIVAEPLRVQGRYGRAERGRVDELLARVGLDGRYGDRTPATLSGGQRQRLSIARALALEPRLLVLDEPVSALDASIQAQILTLFQDLQRDLGIAYLFISHDLAVVRHLADRLLVMYLGQVVEEGTGDAVFGAPRHPYTHGLLSAVPVDHPSARGQGPGRLAIGEPADPTNPPSGCVYRTRCYRAADSCAETAPVLLGPAEHREACAFPQARSLVELRGPAG